MYGSSNARSAYAAAPIRTARGAEYAVFALVTQRLAAVDESDRMQFPRLAEAVYDNQRLWTTLAEDVMGDGNRLPLQLRAQLVSIAEFVRRHSMAVLRGNATLGALIDINTSIMKGLREQLEPAL
jgi:flagellar protein FlaF